MNIGRSMALAACLSLCTLAGSAFGYEWQHASAPGEGCRQMAVAPDGSLYMATNGALSKWNGSGWDTEDVPMTANPQGSLGSVDLRFTPDGRPHIVYVYSGWADSDIVYCTKNNGVWTKEFVTRAAAGLTQSACLTIDKYGRVVVPVVLGVSGESEALYMMTKGPTGSWVQSTVDASFRAAWWPDAEFDKAGNLCVAYTTGASDDLKYGVRKYGAWSFSILDRDGATGWEPSLEISKDGLARISYFDLSESKCYLTMENTPGVFTRYALDNGYSDLCDLQLMADGSPIVTYMARDLPEGWPTSVKFAMLENGVMHSYQVGDSTTTGTMYKDYFTTATVGNQLFVSYTGTDGNGYYGGELWYATVPEPSSMMALFAGIAGVAPLILRRRK